MIRVITQVITLQTVMASYDGVITSFAVITSMGRRYESDHTSDHASDRDGLL